MPTFESNNYYGIIRDAMRQAGYLRSGENPDSQNLADYGVTLTDLVKLWQTQGLKLFLNRVITFPIVAGQSLYVLGPAGNVPMAKPTRVIQANILNPQGIRRPLVVLAWEEWMRLSQVQGNNSTISSYLVDKQITALNVRFWNTPDATEALNQAELLVQVQQPAVDSLTTDMAFPEEWRIALIWGLADEISTGQPQAIMSRCASRATAYREMLENWDVEDAPTTFAMDSRNSYTTGGFS